MTGPKLAASCRIRSTPYTPCVEALGVSGYSVVNHTILPKGFGRSVEEDYWHLREHVQLWDVGCQRQVELKGPDAARLAQWMTPRNLQGAVPGQCLYAPLVDECGGMINDPVILKLAEDWFWFSIADSDVLLWAKGLALGMGLDVEICEPDVWPLAVQGPKADDLMVGVIGNAIRKLKFFRFAVFYFEQHPVIIARSGYSKQGGFELYLDKPELGVPLWEALWDGGQRYEVAPGCPNLIERVEGGLISYGNEMTRANNPLECGLGKYCDLSGAVDFIGREALIEIADKGIDRQIRGMVFDGEACSPCRWPWAIMVGEQKVGQVTSAIWSPRLEANVALGMVDRGFWDVGQSVEVVGEDGVVHRGRVTDLPM